MIVWKGCLWGTVSSNLLIDSWKPYFAPVRTGKTLTSATPNKQIPSHTQPRISGLLLPKCQVLLLNFCLNQFKACLPHCCCWSQPLQPFFTLLRSTEWSEKSGLEIRHSQLLLLNFCPKQLQVALQHCCTVGKVVPYCTAEPCERATLILAGLSMWPYFLLQLQFLTHFCSPRILSFPEGHRWTIKNYYGTSSCVDKDKNPRRISCFFGWKQNAGELDNQSVLSAALPPGRTLLSYRERIKKKSGSVLRRWRE